MPDKNIKFLRQIAAYFTRPNAERPLGDITFVLPNKRSAMFLKKYVRECVTETVLMPRFITMGRLVSHFSEFPQASRKELLFILYDAYRNVMRRRSSIDNVRDFDSFIFWGDMILNDFDDIDRSMVRAEELFRNIRSVKEIQADYLDEQQKEIVRRLWGENRLTTATTDFWLHTPHSDGEAKSEISRKFLYLWEILGELYTEFKTQLRQAGLNTVGGTYRSAAEKLRKATIDDLPYGTHYVFAGFCDLYPSELLIFDRFKSIGAASFFWDTASTTLKKVSDAKHENSTVLRRLFAMERNLPHPRDFEPATNDAPPADTEVIAIPSNIGQAKHIHSILKEWIKQGVIDTENPVDTAIVLPDESLLLPVLFSIPKEIKAVNITMGLPYNTTTFASLLRSIISMQQRARTIHGVFHFYYEDVMQVLSHPHIRLLIPDECERIKASISNDFLYNISSEQLLSDYPMLKPLFTPVYDEHNIGQVGTYMLELIEWLKTGLDALSHNRPELLESKILDHFRQEVEDIRSLTEQYRVEMSENTFFSLFERMFNSAQIVMSGTPLKGLQIMGVLETRALDFDNVIILSMNERVFPRKQYARSMIPNNLRIGYGLPDFDAQEGSYAYCFYRLLARASRVKLLYDSRTASFGAGEASRYILQLKYLMPELPTRFLAVELPASSGESRSITVQKDEEVMRHLRQLLSGGVLSLSASALKTYKKCPLQFYLQYVMNMRGDDELTDFVSAAEYGSIVHKVIELLYTPYENKAIHADLINRWIDPNNKLIDDLVENQVYEHSYKSYIRNDGAKQLLPAEGQVVCSVIRHLVRTMLAYERDAFCTPSFTFIKAEMTVKKPAWQITPELAVNFRMSVDRVDRANDGLLRFIDFKTGGDEIDAPDIEALFHRGEHRYDAIFQVLTYCEAYNAMVDPEADIHPAVYPVRKLSFNGGILPVTIGKTPITSHKSISDRFLPLLRNMVTEIFDPSTPFTQAEDSKACTFCPFLSLCGRSLPSTF